MAATVIPMPKFMAFSDAGAPLSAGLVYTYAAGTTTPLATYSDSDLITPNANPVVLDSAGRATIYLTASSYKIVLKNSAGATVYTQDNIISSAPYNVDLDVPITAGEALTAGQAIYLSDGTGSRTAGRWYLTDSDIAAYSTLPITGFVTTTLTLGEEGSVRLLGQATVPGPVSVGLSYYLTGTPGAIGTTAGTFIKNMGTADSTTTVIMTVATSASPGGTNTQVQFNDSGSFGGDSGFTFIKATDAVAIVGPLTVGGTLGVVGATTLSSTVATGALTVTGAATVSSTLGVTGAVTGGTYNNQTISSAANLTGTLAVGGLLTVSGFGTHSFSAGGTGANTLQVINSTSGAGNFGRVTIGAGTSFLYAYALSQGFTSSGFEQASGGVIYTSGAGGLSILANDASGAIRFYSGGSTERMRLSAAGNLAVGGTPTDSFRYEGIFNGSVINGMKLDDSAGAVGANFIRFMVASSIIGSIDRVGATSAVAYSTTSDVRLKRDRGVVKSTDILARTIIHDFEWIADGTTGRGVFAQEAFTVAPFAVARKTDDTRGADGLPRHPWGVDYSKFVPDLIVGWQQHDATIQSLTARIAALEAGA